MTAISHLQHDTIFIRTRITWLAYWMLTSYSFVASMLGPMLVFLRDDLQLNYTLGGLHLTTLAVGMIISGLTVDRVAGWVGRKRVMWSGALGVPAGIFAIIAGRTVWVTMPGFFIVGLAGSWVQIMVQAILADTHGSRKAVALTEANIGASISSALAPLAVGLAVRWGLGWRAALIVGIFFYLALVWIYRKVQLPAASAGQAGSQVRGRLPGMYWVYWIVIVLVVAAEWCFLVWSTDYLEKVLELSGSDAALLVSVFFGTMVAGRVFGSRLTRKVPVQYLLTGTIVWVLVIFPLFWLPEGLVLRVAGLALIGLGVGNLFPFALSTAISQAGMLSDMASARISLAVGSAALFAPALLGRVADSVGIWRAFGMVPVFGVLSLAVTLWGNWKTSRRRGMIS